MYQDSQTKINDNCVGKEAVSKLTSEVEAMKATLIKLNTEISSISLHHQPTCTSETPIEVIASNDHNRIEVVAEIHAEDSNDISVASVEELCSDPN